ncbi:MAG: type II secretion system protein GspH [Betaproteobacteria bacterium]|nr:type II secretion system protein GspH [Betaproteobacteria bacterium]
MVPPALTGCAGRGQAALQSGLTLIELMVVIVLMAVLSAAVLVGQRDPDRQTLQRQAERLTAELEAARSFSRSSGRKLVLVPREGGFAIEGRGQGAPTQPWMHPEIEVQWGVNPATRMLVLGPEPIIAAQSITLRLRALELKLVTDGLGPFRVQTTP